MLLDFAGTHDVHDRLAGGFEVIRDERAMTLPPERFGAHDGRTLLVGEFQQAIDAGAKFRCHHEIRIAPEGFVAPDRVGGIGRSLAASAKFWKMSVGDAGICERSGKIFRIEMRLPP